MKRSITTALTGLFLSTTVARAEIREIRTMSEARPAIRPKTIVVFDLDNTVIESKTSLGGDQWYSRLVEEYRATGVSEREAKDLAVRRWRKVQPLVQVQLVEPGTRAWISQLKADGHIVIGLTARPEATRSDTLRQLRDVDVRLDGGLPEQNVCFTLEVRSCFGDGILFVNNSNKGEAFLRLASELGWNVKDVVLIDDKAHNVEDFAAALDAWNAAHPRGRIKHLELRYGAADARVAAYDHNVAAVQERLLEGIVSDDVARQVRDAGI